MAEISEQMEQLKAVQSKERKELQAKVTALKHSIQKNDKKMKKDVGQQIEDLEKGLKQKHEKEILALTTQSVNEIKIGDDDDDGKSTEEAGNGETTNGTGGQEPAPFFKEIQLSKAQQKKENRRKKQDATRAAAVAEDEQNAQSSQNHKEREGLQRALAQRGLQLHEVQPDGDCLYSALAHQCQWRRVGNHSATALRQMAAEHIGQRRDVFLPFLVNADGNPLDESEIDEYCDKVAATCSQGGSWGGEPELLALSTVLGRRIEVFHGNGRADTFGEEFSGEGEPLILAYHKHAFALGEHYNSTMPMRVEEDEGWK